MYKNHMDCIFGGKYKYQTAFTLAEVLITLVVIGIIAAVTVPILWGEYQKQITIEQLKKTYSALAQTTNRAIVDNGSIQGWEVGNAESTEDTKKFFNTYMAPYLSLAKAPTTSSEGNWDSKYYYLNGNENTYASYALRAYLQNGVSLTIRISQSNDTQKRILIHFDTNGDKRPNKLGRDLFVFDYYVLSNIEQINGKFTPAGYQFDRETLLSSGSYYNCNKNSTGSYCSALIMKDGWQIKKDYPW